MTSQIAKNSLLEFLKSPGTLCMWIFTLSTAIFGYLANAYWYFGNNFPFHFYLMAGLVVVPSFYTLDRAFSKLMPKNRAPFGSNWTVEIVITRLAAGLAMWLIIAVELIGLGIFVNSVMPDVYQMPITVEIKDLQTMGIIYGSIGIPALVFYWQCVLKKKQISRRAFLFNKYRC